MFADVLLDAKDYNISETEEETESKYHLDVDFPMLLSQLTFILLSNKFVSKGIFTFFHKPMR